LSTKKRYPTIFIQCECISLLREQFQWIGDAIAREKQIKQVQEKTKNTLIRP
jgi:putative endonuclease